MLANLLEIEKEEGLVFFQRSANGETILISYVVRFFAGVEEVASVEIGSLTVPPAAAVKIVSTLFQHHVHDGAAVIAELGSKAVVLNLKFLNNLDRRLIVDVGISALALFRGADGTAVQGNLGRGVTLPVRDKVGPGRVVVGNPRTRGFCHPTRQKHQPKHAAGVERNVPHILVGDIGSESSTFRIQQRWSSSHLHGRNQS